MTLINSKTSDFNYLIDFDCSNIFKISNTSISGSYLLFKNALEIDSLTMDVFYFSKCIPIQFLFRFTRGVGKRGPFLESFYTKIILEWLYLYKLKPDFKGAFIYYVITLVWGVQTQMMTLMMPLGGGDHQNDDVIYAWGLVRIVKVIRSEA